MSRPSAATLARVRAHLEAEADDGYAAAAGAAGELAEGRLAAAAALGAEPDEVALLTGASDGIAQALGAIPWRAGDRVVLSREDWGLQGTTYRWLAQERGTEIVVVDHGDDGLLDLDRLDAALASGARLVSLCHVPMWTGVVQPFAEVAARAHAAGALLFVDAAQSLGQTPVRAAADGADILVATGRKWLRGPRGTGLLVLRGAAAELAPPLVGEFSHRVEGDRLVPARGARAFERHEANIAALLGLGVALRELLDAGPAAVAGRVAAVAADLRARVRALPGVRLADPPAATAGIVAVTVDGVPPADVVAGLAERGVSSRWVPPSDVPWSSAVPVVRLSPHVYTTAADLDAATDALAQVARTGAATPAR
jgi:selenocysteine lyase/cysteine desulfurase